MKAHEDARQLRLERLYYRAIRPREAVAEAKAWLLDCFGDDPEAVQEIQLIAAIGTVQKMDVLYAGGWTQFLRDGDNLKVAA